MVICHYNLENNTINFRVQNCKAFIIVNVSFRQECLIRHLCYSHSSNVKWYFGLLIKAKDNATTTYIKNLAHFRHESENSVTSAIVTIGGNGDTGHGHNSSSSPVTLFSQPSSASLTAADTANQQQTQVQNTHRSKQSFSSRQSTMISFLNAKIPTRGSFKLIM